VIPKGSRNLAFIGQLCEMPKDVVFTVEYSARSAQTAVYELLKLDRKPPAVYKGEFYPKVLYRAFLALSRRLFPNGRTRALSFRSAKFHCGWSLTAGKAKDGNALPFVRRQAQTDLSLDTDQGTKGGTTPRSS
jgi:hypothetical protein